MTDIQKIRMAQKLVDMAGDIVSELYNESDLRQDVKDVLNTISGFTANAFNELGCLPYRINNPEEYQINEEQK